MGLGRFFVDRSGLSRRRRKRGEEVKGREGRREGRGEGRRGEGRRSGRRETVEGTHRKGSRRRWRAFTGRVQSPQGLWEVDRIRVLDNTFLSHTFQVITEVSIPSFTHPKYVQL